MDAPPPGRDRAPEERLAQHVEPARARHRQERERHQRARGDSAGRRHRAPPQRHVQERNCAHDVCIVRVEHGQGEEGAAAHQPARKPTVDQRNVQPPEDQRNERRGKARRVTPEQRAETGRGEGEGDAGDRRAERGPGVAPRQRVGGETREREREKHQEVVGRGGPERAEHGEREREGKEGLREVPARPVDPKLIRIPEQGRRSEQAVPHEPEVVVELKDVTGGARHEGLGTCAPGGERQALPPLQGKWPRDYEAGDEEQDRQQESGLQKEGGPQNGPSMRRRSNETPTPPR